MVCFRYVIVNTLLKGENDDDDDDNNSLEVPLLARFDTVKST
jgi:hypothetical protein